MSRNSEANKKNPLKPKLDDCEAEDLIGSLLLETINAPATSSSYSDPFKRSSKPQSDSHKNGKQFEISSGHFPGFGWHKTPSSNDSLPLSFLGNQIFGCPSKTRIKIIPSKTPPNPNHQPRNSQLPPKTHQNSDSKAKINSAGQNQSKSVKPEKKPSFWNAPRDLKGKQTQKEFGNSTPRGVIEQLSLKKRQNLKPLTSGGKPLKSRGKQSLKPLLCTKDSTRENADEKEVRNTDEKAKVKKPLLPERAGNCKHKEDFQRSRIGTGGAKPPHQKFRKHSNRFDRLDTSKKPKRNQTKNDTKRNRSAKKGFSVLAVESNTSSEDDEETKPVGSCRKKTSAKSPLKDCKPINPPRADKKKANLTLWNFNETVEKQNIRNFWEELSVKKRRQLTSTPMIILIDLLVKQIRLNCSCNECPRKAQRIYSELVYFYNRFYDSLKDFDEENRGVVRGEDEELSLRVKIGTKRIDEQFLENNTRYIDRISNYLCGRAKYRRKRKERAKQRLEMQNENALEMENNLEEFSGPPDKAMARGFIKSGFERCARELAEFSACAATQMLDNAEFKSLMGSEEAALAESYFPHTCSKKNCGAHPERTPEDTHEDWVEQEVNWIRRGFDSLELNGEDQSLEFTCDPEPYIRRALKQCRKSLVKTTTLNIDDLSNSKEQYHMPDAFLDHLTNSLDLDAKEKKTRLDLVRDELHLILQNYSQEGLKREDNQHRIESLIFFLRNSYRLQEIVRYRQEVGQKALEILHEDQENKNVNGAQKECKSHKQLRKLSLRQSHLSNQQKLVQRHFDEQTAVQREMFKQMLNLFEVVIFEPPLENLTAQERVDLLRDFQPFSFIDDKLYEKLLTEKLPDLFDVASRNEVSTGDESGVEEESATEGRTSEEERRLDELFSQDESDCQSDGEIFEEKIFGDCCMMFRCLAVKSFHKNVLQAYLEREAERKHRALLEEEEEERKMKEWRRAKRKEKRKKYRQRARQKSVVEK